MVKQIQKLKTKKIDSKIRATNKENLNDQP